MIELTGNIWSVVDKDPIGRIVITTNGYVNKSGACVMGRGIAAQAKIRHPDLPFELGNQIREFGNRVFYFEEYCLFSFPTKHVWWENSDLSLIKQSVEDLEAQVSALWLGKTHIYLPRPGCGNGNLDWDVVKPIVEVLPDNFVVVNNG